MVKSKYISLALLELESNPNTTEVLKHNLSSVNVKKHSRCALITV